MSLQFAAADTASHQAANRAALLAHLDADEASMHDDCPTMAARGIITAMALSVPIWLLVGIAAFKLI